MAKENETKKYVNVKKWCNEHVITSVTGRGYAFPYAFAVFGQHCSKKKFTPVLTMSEEDYELGEQINQEVQAIAQQFILEEHKWIIGIAKAWYRMRKDAVYSQLIRTTDFNHFLYKLGDVLPEYVPNTILRTRWERFLQAVLWDSWKTQDWAVIRQGLESLA